MIDCFKILWGCWTPKTINANWSSMAIEKEIADSNSWTMGYLVKFWMIFQRMDQAIGKKTLLQTTLRWYERKSNILYLADLFYHINILKLYLRSRNASLLNCSERIKS